MSEQPVVGIVMGSDSDWPVMKAAAEALDEFGVRYEADEPYSIISCGIRCADTTSAS